MFRTPWLASAGRTGQTSGPPGPGTFSGTLEVTLTLTLQLFRQLELMRVVFGRITLHCQALLGRLALGANRSSFGIPQGAHSGSPGSSFAVESELIFEAARGVRGA